MKIVVIYPGRFQPFALHHFKAYKFISSVFGPSNVYIATSNKIDHNSPLSFNEKIPFIRKLINNNNIVQCISPFQPKEILNNFNPMETICIFCNSSKDEDRIAFLKKDGSNSKFRPLIAIDQCLPFSQELYVYNIPKFQITIPGICKELSSSSIRNFFKNIDELKLNYNKHIFKKIFGYWDYNLYSLLVKKIKK